MLGDRDYMRANEGSGFGPLRDPRTWTAVQLLLILNLAVFVLQHFIFLKGAPFWTPEGNPAGGVSVRDLKEGHVWTLFTYMFVHSGFQSGGLAFLHILGNMLVLFFCGRPLESRVGRLWTYLIFLGGGLCGALLELLLSNNTYLIGASGGTMAILLGFTAIEPGRRIMILIPLPVELQLRTLGRLVLGLSLLLGVVKLAMGDGGGGRSMRMLTDVAHFAHLGGALFGMLVVKRLRPTGRDPFEMSRGDILRGVSEPTGKSGGGFMKWWSRGWKKKPVVVPPRDKGLDEREYDEILDKVSERGLQSLTAEERRKLTEASERMSSRDRRRDG